MCYTESEIDFVPLEQISTHIVLNSHSSSNCDFLHTIDFLEFKMFIDFQYNVH
jgi:hypothetical protein